MLQAILKCAQASFDHYDENRDVWMTVRNHCKDLLSAEDLSRYQELFNKHNDEDNHQTDWSDLLEKFYPEDKDIGSSDYKGQANLCDDFENKLKDMREKVIAYDQLKTFSLYLKDKPAELAAYRKFLVSIYCFVHAYIIVVTIISHHHSVGSLQS
jgi:hypothetical protein